MALNFPTVDTDFVQRTAESRTITKTLIGDFSFDRFLSRNRNKLFLQRNMTKVLAFHDQNRIRGLQTGTYQSSSSRARGPFLDHSVVKRSSPYNASGVYSRDLDEPRNSAQQEPNTCELTEAKPDIESMSQECLKVKVRNGSIGEKTREKRRSMRQQMLRQHDDKNAQLYLDFVNIRKKLNFKESTIDVEDRPQKRVRRETVACHAHVTIWDNRNSIEKEPIIRKSETCEVSTSDVGATGLVADIKLRAPFIFNASDLMVPLKTTKGNVLGIGDNYFVEIKIIPTRHDAVWPPIPVLGRSEGDQIANIGRLVAEKLENSLLMRYYHLPQAPSSDVPLSVFYLHEGSTYRSKYGLEVNSVWTKGEMPETMVKREDDDDIQLNLWAVDEAGQFFGTKTKSLTDDTLVRSSSRNRTRQKRNNASSVKVTFNIDGASAKCAKDFRQATLAGLRCPTCPAYAFDSVDELQFHFSTFHSKYKFTLEKQEYDPVGDILRSVSFKISSINTTRSRNQDKEARTSDRDLRWQAPVEPLDLRSYVNGDQDWVDQNWVEGAPKKADMSASTAIVAADPISSIRQRQYTGYEPAQKGGFLPAEHVADFRQPARTKYPNVKLQTLTADKETMYTSISHRQIQTDEESRSESDDEMDDRWFIQKSLEALDLAAEKHKWTDEQRILRRKWHQKRLNEKLSHPRYLSDCLIRFVRAEREWLNHGRSKHKLAFAELLDELLQRRVINQEVIRDVWMILHKGEEGERSGSGPTSQTKQQTATEKLPTMYDQAQDPQPTLAIGERLLKLAAGRNKDQATTDKIATIRDKVRKSKNLLEVGQLLLQLPPYTCAECYRPISDLRRHGVRCSDLGCDAPGLWFHDGCVACKWKDRLSWKCRACIAPPS